MKSLLRRIVFFIPVFFCGVSAMWCCAEGSFMERGALVSAIFDHSDILSDELDALDKENDGWPARWQGEVSCDCNDNVSVEDDDNLTLVPSPYVFQMKSKECTQKDKAHYCWSACWQDKVSCDDKDDNLTLVASSDIFQMKSRECTQKDKETDDWSACGQGEASCDDKDDNLTLVARSEPVQLETDDAAVKFESPRKKNPASVREERLLTRLKQEGVCFAKVKHNDYSGMDISVFQLDLLNLMHKNCDIYEKDGCYHYRGTLEKLPEPSENIAVAMCKLLPQKPTLFNLRFQLYSQGYRQYSPVVLGYMETALFVGGVHPCDKPLQEQSVFHQNIQKVWSHVCKLDETKFYNYFLNPPEDYADLLRQRRFQQVVLILWNLQKEGVLDRLKSMHLAGNFPAQTCKKNKACVEFSASKNTPLRRQIFAFLQKNTNQDVPIDDLQGAVCCRKGDRAQPSVFLRTFLLFAMDDHKIVYNKDKKTVKLLDKDPPAVQKKENANLLTAVYDLIVRYGKVTQEEITYYAVREGYCQLAGKVGVKKQFSEQIHSYREVLAVQGYVASECCSTKRSLDIERQTHIWALVQEEDVVRELLYYKGFCGKGVTQDDIDAVNAAKIFQQKPEFAVLINYIKDKRRAITATKTSEEIVVDWFRAGPRLYSKFVRVCPGFGIPTLPEMWKMAGVLTGRTQGGRLCYNPTTTLFSWDDAGCAPIQKKELLVASVFSLRKEYPYMSNQELLHMIRQNGFQDVTLQDLHGILQGLSVLGLCRTYDNDLVRERGVVDALLSKRESACTGWRLQVAQRVVNWFKDDTISSLWATYLYASESAGPPCKRQKTQMQGLTAADIICLEIPAGYKILMQKFPM